MIVTVTPNTGLDHVLLLDRFRPGRRNQAVSRLVCMGGKGTDVSLILGRLGVASVAVGFLGGETGDRVERMLADAGARTAFVRVAGETRINTVLFEQETGVHTTVCAEGLRVSDADVQALTTTVMAVVGEGDTVVFAGSLPKGVPIDAYMPLIAGVQEKGARAILDSSGPYLKAGLGARPWAVKPNREELESVVGPLDDDGGDLAALRHRAIEGAWSLLTHGVTRVVASLGAAGLVAVEGESGWVAAGLDVSVANPAGAGDAVVAAMALGAERGWSLEEALREAVALATAVVVTPGTAECDVSRLDEFRRRIMLTSYPLRPPTPNA